MSLVVAFATMRLIVCEFGRMRGRERERERDSVDRGDVHRVTIIVVLLRGLLFLPPAREVEWVRAAGRMVSVVAQREREKEWRKSG